MVKQKLDNCSNIPISQIYATLLRKGVNADEIIQRLGEQLVPNFSFDYDTTENVASDMSRILFSIISPYASKNIPSDISQEQANKYREFRDFNRTVIKNIHDTTLEFLESLQSVYITESNLKRIIQDSDLKDISFDRTVYEDMKIYFFNKYEERYLLAIQNLLENPENYFTQYYKPLNITDKYKYVYEGGKPSYHCSIDCPSLNSNFENYIIPEIIRDKGKEEVIRFREWFHTVKEIFEEDKELFTYKLHMKWGVISNPQSISSINSGSIEIKNYDLEQLMNEIDILIKKAGKFYYESEKNKTILKQFSKYSFLANQDKIIQNNNTGYSDNVVKGLLKEYNDLFKKPLKKMLVEYYKLKYNPSIELKGYLLNQLGFKPCKTCYNKANR